MSFLSDRAATAPRALPSRRAGARPPAAARALSHRSPRRGRGHDRPRPCRREAPGASRPRRWTTGRSSASSWRFSGLPATPRYWIAFRCRSGLPAPRAMSVITLRACGRVALREHEQRALLELRRLRALQQLLQHRHGLRGVGVLQALDGEQLQLLVGLRLRPDRLPGGPPQLHLEGAGVAQPAALGNVRGEIRESSQGVGVLGELGLRVGEPVHRGVDTALAAAAT